MSTLGTESTLRTVDSTRCIEQLPPPVRDALVQRPGRLVLAGGFVRDVVTGDEIRDVDLFVSDNVVAVAVAHELSRAMSVGIHCVGMHGESRVLTLASPRPVQVSSCTPFDRPEEVVEKFDFTVCRASLWYDGEAWQSRVDPRFYPDAAARRLRYCSPERPEDHPGASLVRILKFYQRGYRVSPASLARVVARFVEVSEERDLQLDASIKLGLESDAGGQSYYVEDDADER